MSTPLYDISERLQKLLQDDDIDAQTFADTFEAVEGEFKAKAEAVALYLHSLASDALAVKTELQRLTARHDAIEARRQSLRTYLVLHMKRTGIEKIKTPLVSMSVQKGKEYVHVLSEGAVPSEFLRTHTSIDKTAIKAQLEAGNPIPGAELRTGADYLLLR